MLNWPIGSLFNDHNLLPLLTFFLNSFNIVLLLIIFNNQSGILLSHFIFRRKVLFPRNLFRFELHLLQFKFLFLFQFLKSFFLLSDLLRLPYTFLFFLFEIIFIFLYEIPLLLPCSLRDNRRHLYDACLRVDFRLLFVSIWGCGR